MTGSVQDSFIDPQNFPLKVDFLSVVNVRDGVMWYTIKVVEKRQEWFVRKRYNDFAALHAQLLGEYCRHAGTVGLHHLIPASASVPDDLLEPLLQPQEPRSKPPPLPEAGLFGLRHRLNICGFNRKRFMLLQEYLETLVLRARSLDADALLDQFLRQAISGVREIPRTGDTGGTP